MVWFYSATAARNWSALYTGKGTFRSYEAAGDPAADNGTLRDMARRMRAVDAPKAEAV